MNSFGNLLRLTTFGESHGPAMGGILDGMPSRVPFDAEAVQQALCRRRPGSGAGRSARKETDIIRILSGVSPEGLTLGTPIGFMIPNVDARPGDYSRLLRPNHADYTYEMKYGIRAVAGGGRASARETASWVAAGAMASMLTRPEGITIRAAVSGVGEWESADPYSLLLLPAEAMEIVEKAGAAGDSVGGLVSCVVSGVPAGLGEPVFDKLHSRLAAAMMSINAAKCFEYGLGRKAARSYGSETADPFVLPPGASCPEPAGDFSGGIQGGISNGRDIRFTVAFKPTPTLMRDVESFDIEGNRGVIPARGRHDVCVALRAPAVVEAMAALVVADALLASRLPLKSRV